MSLFCTQKNLPTANKCQPKYMSIKMDISKSESETLHKDLQLLENPQTKNTVIELEKIRWERMNKPANINQLVVIGKLINQVIN
jgi:hypothetical protein